MIPCSYRKLRSLYYRVHSQISYSGKRQFVVAVVQLLSRVWLFCNPMDFSPPSSSVHGILQTRTLERTAVSSSRGSSWPRDRTHTSYIGRWLLYHWATGEAQKETKSKMLVQKLASLHCLNYSVQSHFSTILLSSPSPRRGKWGKTTKSKSEILHQRQ